MISYPLAKIGGNVMLKKLGMLSIVTLFLLIWTWRAQAIPQKLPQMGNFDSILEFDPTWLSTEQVPFEEKSNQIEFRKAIGSVLHIEFPKILNPQTPIRIHTELGEVRQYLASGGDGEYRAKLLGRYLVYKGREGSILYRYDADKKALREFVYLPKASSLPKDGQVIRWRFEGATMQEQNDGSITFTKTADIPRKSNTVQKTLFKIPPPEYIDANHQVIRTGIHHTVAKNQLALNLGSNSSLNFPLWVDPTIVPTSEAKGSLVEEGAGYIGDYNNDGFDDVFTRDNNQIKIYFGQTFPLPATLVPDIIISRSDGKNFVNKVVSAGNLNGDAFEDFMIASPATDTNGTSTGAVYVFFGQSPASQLNLDISDADLTINGTNGGDVFGFYADTLGNFDGVGNDDIVVFAQNAILPGSNPEVRTGTAYVFQGGNITSPATWDAETDADLIIRGTGPEDINIVEVASVGDFNNDGKKDLGIRTVEFGENNGEVVVYGSTFVGPDLQAVTLDTFPGVGPNRIIYSFDSAGDFNNDGFGDIIVGDANAEGQLGPCRGFTGADAGAVAIHLGHADGQPSPGSIDILPCVEPEFGLFVWGIGDVDGDGIDDVAIYRPNVPDYAIFSGRTSLPTAPLWDDLDAQFIIGGQSLPPQPSGDFDNDNVNDFLANSILPNQSLFFSFNFSRPVITLLGSSALNVEVGIPYVEAGATAFDIEDGDITGQIIVTGLPIDTSFPGTHQITYNATDSDGNAALELIRTVNVIQKNPPSTLSGFQDGALPDGSYGGTEDSYLVQRSPSANFGNETSLEADGVDFDPASGKYGEVAAIIKWDISSTPATAQVSRVFITFNYSDASSGVYHFYSQNSPWSESTVSWNDMDQGPTILSTLPPFSFELGSVELNENGVALVQGWVDGTIPNNGFIIRSGGTNNGIRMDSSESSGFRPKIDIVFSNDAPAPGLNKNNLYTESCNSQGQSGQTSISVDCFCQDLVDVPLSFKCIGSGSGVSLMESGVSLSDPSGIGKVTCAWNKDSGNTSTFTTEAICFNVNNN